MTIKDLKDEFDGLELRTTTGRPPEVIVVRRSSVHDFIERTVHEIFGRIPSKSDPMSREEILDMIEKVQKEYENN